VKIAFANDVLYAYASEDAGAVGGAERQQWLLARALAQKGWEAVVGVRHKLKPGNRRTIDGVEFVGVGQDHALIAWRRLLLSERPDWWYRRSADHLLGPAMEMAKWTGVRTIFSAAFDSDVLPRRALTRRQRWWPLYAWGLERADRIFVQHERQLSLLPSRWRSKTVLVPSIAAETVTVKDHANRQKYVAWAAMLRQPKRPDLLIDIARKAPDLTFVVCGEPTAHRSPQGYGEKIVETLRSLPNVDYRGRVSPADARQIIAEAAAYLLTSDEEGFPNTFLEAWSGGTPVVSLQVDPGGTMARERIGLVTGSTERTVSALRSLVDSPQQRQEIALRATHYVTGAHSEEAAIAAFELALLNPFDNPQSLQTTSVARDRSIRSHDAT